MKLLKKISLIIFMIMSFYIFSLDIYAINKATISIKSNKTTAVVGETITFKIVISSSASLGNWDFDIGYDSSYFSFVSSTLEGNTGSSLGLTKSGIKSYDYTLKLKAKKSGTTTVYIKEKPKVEGWDEKAMDVSVGSKKLTLKTQEEINSSKSSNNNLSSLSISDYSISPKFSSNTKSYSLTVPNDVTSVKVNAKASHDKAKISGTGNRKLEEGTNKLDITVTAENGNKKTYTINVTRKELDPIKVSIDGKEYTVVRKSDKLDAPDGYKDIKVTIEEKEVPGFTSEITDYTLVGLSDTDGNINLYIYKDDNYTLYKEYKFNGVTIYPKEPRKLLKDLKTSHIKINDTEVTSYELKDYPYKLIYGMNVETGKDNWYSYDEKEGTFQIFAGVNEVGTTVTKTKTDDKFMILSVILGVFTGIFFFTTIILTIKNKKKTGINY